MNRSEISVPSLSLLRRVCRLSTLIRLAWVAVALLHAWLIARRVLTGQVHEWLDLLKLVLSAGAIWYALLKFWSVATLFDNAPRRALCFALLLLFGHWLIASPEAQAMYEHAPIVALTTLAVLPVLELAVALTLGLLCLGALLRLALPVPKLQPAPLFQLHPWLHPAAQAPPDLWRRPPPTCR